MEEENAIVDIKLEIDPTTKTRSASITSIEMKDPTISTKDNGIQIESTSLFIHDNEKSFANENLLVEDQVQNDSTSFSCLLPCYLKFSKAIKDFSGYFTEGKDLTNHTAERLSTLPKEELSFQVSTLKFN